MLQVSPSEQARFERIWELLKALDWEHERSASVLLDLTDDETPSDFAVLRAGRTGLDRHLPLSAGMRTEQLMKRAATREGRPGGKVDREQRDVAILSLRERGIVEKAYVVPLNERGELGELVVRGYHRTKSGNNSYVVTDEARALLDAPEPDWPKRLQEFVAGDPRRRTRAMQRTASEAVQRAAAGNERHKALIRAAVDSLVQTRCPGFELVFVDDEDGVRVRDEWRVKLQPLDLMPDEGEGRWPDALLVRGRDVWVVDAVTGDGEVDEVRREELEAWLNSRGYQAVPSQSLGES